MEQDKTLVQKSSSVEDKQMIGKYVIQEILGQGAMGIVYRAIDPLIQRTVALKTIRFDAFSPSQLKEVRQRFLHEAQAAGRLNHQHIVILYDFGESDEITYLAMEYVEGTELQHYLKNNHRFSFSKVIDIISQILDGLLYVHSHNIIHRDLKPANIMLEKDGNVKIMDFGIARVDTSILTTAGAILGTPSYMSPEQCMGNMVDARSDLFSVGVILYQLLTGEKPFFGENPHTIMHRVLHTQPEPPSVLNMQIPAEFNDIVNKAMAKHPDERFQSAEEFLQALHCLAKGSFTDKPPVTDTSPVIENGQETIVEEKKTLILVNEDASPEADQISKQYSKNSKEKNASRGVGKGVGFFIFLLLVAGGIAFFFLQPTKQGEKYPIEIPAIDKSHTRVTVNKNNDSPPPTIQTAEKKTPTLPPATEPEPVPVLINSPEIKTPESLSHTEKDMLIKEDNKQTVTEQEEILEITVDKHKQEPKTQSQTDTSSTTLKNKITTEPIVKPVAEEEQIKEADFNISVPSIPKSDNMEWQDVKEINSLEKGKQWKTIDTGDDSSLPVIKLGE